jgi:class 3 adenylate cyclase
MAETPEGSAGVSGAEPRADFVATGERRQLTVFFCDLVGSTALSEYLDPEDLREIILSYQQCCAGVIEPLGGHVAQYLGDGILAYFGFPRAHEDDALRAVRAGLRVIDAVNELNARLPRGSKVQLSVRIGIHTGVAVVGSVGTADNHSDLALGDTPNIAARLQALAETDTVVISEATERLVRGWFESESLGPQVLKGFLHPVRAFTVRGAASARSRLEVAQGRGLSPLVGRQAELLKLLAAWRDVKGGQSIAVFVDGEIGIGKSRLIEELRHQVIHDQGSVIDLRASSYHTRSPLYPLLDLLERSLGLVSSDAGDVRAAKFERGLSSRAFATEEARSLLAPLLSIPDPRFPSTPISPQRRMRKIQEALVAWLIELGQGRPSLVVWEDIHWLDPSSLEVIDLLLERAPGHRVLTVATARSESQFHWPKGEGEHLHLERIDRRSIHQLASHVATGAALSEQISHQICDLTDGIPLFVEELTRSLVESGALLGEENGPGHPSAASARVPATLRDSLMARLDRLPFGKEVARVAATAGREVDEDLLRAIWPFGQGSLNDGLGELQAAKLLLRRPDGFWIFAHAFTQEVAYDSLLRSSRRQYHRLIAETLERIRPALSSTQPELLAQHYTLAESAVEAIALWYRAGRLAIDRSANVEAIDHLRRGLELLERVAESPKTLQLRLDFLVALGGPEIARRGYAAPEVGALFSQALRLSYKAPEDARLFDAQQGLHVHYLVKGELDTSLKLSHHLLALAQRLGQRHLALEATLRLAISLYALGDLDTAKNHLLQGLLPHLGDEETPSNVRMFGQDTRVSALCHLSLVLWLTGSPREALERSVQALDLSERLAHPFTRSWALLYACMIHVLRDEVTAARARAAELVLLCERHGFAYRRAQAEILLSWALVREKVDAIEPMARAILAVRATGASVFSPYYYALFADACRFAGAADRGLVAVNEALAVVATTAESFYLAEIFRLKGELLQEVSSPDLPAAEAALSDSLALATAQSAHSLVLRTAVSLAEFCRRQGRDHPHARDVLRDALSKVERDGTNTALAEGLLKVI